MTGTGSGNRTGKRGHRPQLDGGAFRKNFTLDKVTVERLDALEALTGRNQSEIVRLAVEGAASEAGIELGGLK